MTAHVELDAKARRHLVRMLTAPRWSRRLPTTADVRRFITTSSADPELRLMVLNDLRDRSAPRSEIMTFATLVVALIAVLLTFAFSFAIAPDVVDEVGWEMTRELLAAATWTFIPGIVLIGLLTLWASGSGRNAVWLRAFEDALQREASADAAHRRRGRRKRRSG